MGIFESKNAQRTPQKSNSIFRGSESSNRTNLWSEPTFLQPQISPQLANNTVQKAENKIVQDEWIKDGEGNLYFNTEAEAMVRKKKLELLAEWKEYRVVSFTNSQGEFWRVEMRGAKSTNETNPESSGSSTYIYQSSDANVYQVWLRIKKEGKTSLNWEEFQELNGGKAAVENVKPGDALKLTKAADETTSAVKVEAAGDLASNKIIYIAWTIDDGPFGESTEKMKTTGLENLKNVTWYIQRWRLEGGDSKYLNMKKIQDQGGEIAIHSFHPSADHVPWFPLTGGSTAYSFPYAGKSQSILMADLKSFDAKLKSYGIKPKFARLPGGLTSELVTYGKNLGYNSSDASAIRTKILKGEDVSAHGENALKIAADYKLLKTTLSELDLLLWGGGLIPEEIRGQSWEAETSGNAYRTDNTTKSVSSQRAGKESNPGIFESRIKDFKDGERRSLVILAHDTTNPDADAVLEDKKEMERLAKASNIRIEYVTMSTIFEKNTKKDPSKYDVNYK